MNRPIISCQKITFKYDFRPILREITLEVYENEYIGIFGPNGGGKTTFLHLLLGFLQPDSGKITVLGSKPKKARKHIGYVPQRIAFDKKFPITTLEVVLLGGLSKVHWWGSLPKEEKQKALEALDMLGMLDYQKHPFGSLSGGQAQRVLIARAVMNSPQILLLDEPTANVDPDAAEEIKKNLRELKKHMTILHVTHELADITDDVHRLFCFQNTLEIYKPKEVCEHFAHGLYHYPIRQDFKGET